MAVQRKRRRRSGGNNNNNNSNPNRHFESNGPDVRIRGSAQQILDKYLQYARDAQTAGDRVKAEALFQHAEHYARIVAVFEAQKEEQRKEREARDAARAEERAARDAEHAEKTGDEASSDAESSAAPETPEPAEASAAPEGSAETPVEIAAEEKPKRRRRSPRKKETPAAEMDDGVAKTLARGTDTVEATATPTEA